ncbi:MAG: penicillin-binding protein 1A [Spirochaetia bacterium]
MNFNKTQRIVISIFLGIACLTAVIVSAGLGIAIASTYNIQRVTQFGAYDPALPSRVLDINGNLITEFFSEEKRDITYYQDIPKHLVYALLTREDKEFFEHQGFSFRGTLRAVWKIVTGQYVSGGSSITQQIAGTLYADRGDFSIARKLRELWYAFQFEYALSKHEIMQIYLNQMNFGHGTRGIEAASQFYFGHSASEITLAEAVILINTHANPTRYSPIRHPNRAQVIQEEILNQMVLNGYVSQEERDESYQQYWTDYDFTRSNNATIFFEREDEAPFFSEHIRNRLDGMLYGSRDIYRDGYVIHTTLDLEQQEIADRIMQQGLTHVNETYRESSRVRLDYAGENYASIIDLLSLAFDLPELHIASDVRRRISRDYFLNSINPVLNISSLLFNIDGLREISQIALHQDRAQSSSRSVEGALICIDNDTGYISAMVGGSQFEVMNQFNRTTQAEVQPGSAFKPLYYSAAISSRDFNPATMIYDSPIYFMNDDGSPYVPVNYGGRFYGPVRLRYALANSLNIPSIRLLEDIGFDSAISRSARLLGITEPEDIARRFPRNYPLGLGIIRVSPIQMARAFATFPNQGREVEPIAIRYIEDREGRIILEPERELRAEQRRMGEDLRIMTEEEAYIMTDMLMSAVDWGTLSIARRRVDGFSMPMAGKTGTTQNWSDAWTVGFSPYMTSAVWFGFDTPGNSLGLNQTGSIAAGPVWANFMEEAHQDLPYREFQRPEEGLVEVSVCRTSGMLPTESCNDGIITELFIEGTEPREFCELHEFEQERNQQVVSSIYSDLFAVNVQIENPGSLDAGDLNSMLTSPPDEFEFQGENEDSDTEDELTNPWLD